ncbi:MAG: Lrp/AsnC family transcriptional regulator [Methylococcales bacterium]|jgi:DNA-binding Lrp family transcriptional regulator|nr:Lrp/AsnC family transcriptional regulator [Methylococcales bacterium]
MTQNDIDHYIMASLQEGLPICSRPYAALARELKLTEQQIVDRIQWLKDNDYIRRYGIIVRHKELGFHANAMVVWDIADDQVTNIGNQLALQSSVTLCYQRPRRLPEWRYNLFSMIHGHDRQEVLNKIETIEQELNLTDVPHKPLFSQRRFKQRGGRFIYVPEMEKQTINYA